MTSPTKILVIGLDAAEPSLLDAWSTTGHLPALRALRASGLHARIENAPGIYTGSVWPSLSTALSPGQAHKQPDGTIIRTLWGELAWQLGGRAGYALVAEADAQGVSPGSDALRMLFDRAAQRATLVVDERPAVHGELALLGDGNLEDLRLRLRLYARIRFGQTDRDLPFLIEGRRNYEEDDQEQHDVDQRRHVDVRLFF